MLKEFGITLLSLTTLLGGTLLQNSKKQEQQQALMTKTDAQRIGTHFSMPREDDEPVEMNLYLIEDGTDHPLVISLHGGAFVLGDADTLDSQSDRISKAWDVNVATVNYKLAGGKYDIAYETQEVIDTVKYFRSHAEEYHIDPDEIFLLGFSAGAYHATAAVLDLKQEGIDVAGQIICYGYIKEANDAYLALNEADRKTIAPALFILADNDPISDRSLNYQRSLERNGVSTQVTKYEGAKHAFIEESNPEYESLKTISHSPEQEVLARQAEDQIGSWIHSILKH